MSLGGGNQGVNLGMPLGGVGGGPTVQQQQIDEQKREFDQKYGLYKDWMAQYNQQVGGFNNLLNQYNTAYAQANAQNEQKYNQQLGLTDQNSGQQRADVISASEKQNSDAMQNLARLGMSNTTVGSTLQQGNLRERNAALNRVADSTLQQKLGVMQGFQYKGMDPGVTQSVISAYAPKTPSFNF
jgi:hypothetical protein